MALLLAVLVGCAPMAPLVQYTQDLGDKRSGRSLVVRAPAKLGGLVGFVAGVPADVVAAPVSYSVYAVRRAQDPVEEPDLLSHLLFPSFLLWRVGALVAAPLDLLEWIGYRAWQPPPTMTAEERRSFEQRLDDEALPRYPVEPVFPRRQPEGATPKGAGSPM